MGITGLKSKALSLASFRTEASQSQSPKHSTLNDGREHDDHDDHDDHDHDDGGDDDDDEPPSP